MVLETKRLKIIPLDIEKFHLLLQGMDFMEKALHLNPSHENLDKHTHQAMTSLYHLALQNKDSHVWFTNWQIILKSENMSIGSACFMDSPNEQGEVELGYGINKNFRCQGYMTEAVMALKNWALSEPNVTTVLAETDKDNIASQKVLENCSFKKYSETQDGYFWKVNK